MLRIRNLESGPVHTGELHADTGERVLLSGDSGSGKSMFLRALADLVPRRGHAELAGQSMDSMPAHQWRRHLILVEADSGWWAERVGDHFPPDSNPQLERLALESALLQASPLEISSGQRQRLAILRALAREPEVLLLDEPSANLDDKSTTLLEALLRDWTDRGGLLLMSSHGELQRHRLATRHWRVRAGRVEEFCP